MTLIIFYKIIIIKKEVSLGGLHFNGTSLKKQGVPEYLENFQKQEKQIS